MIKQERNLGIDLLRIICMLAMVIQHLFGHGWIMQLLNPVSWKYELASALVMACLFGISCFALISGYVGVQSRYRYSALALQWAKVWFYSVCFTWIAGLIFPGSVSRMDWENALLPTLSKQYWYFTAYAASFMLAPIVRIAMKRMSFKQASFCTATLVFVFSILNTARHGDAFFTDMGKGTLWLVVLYAIGAYFGAFKPHERIPMAVLWCFAVFSVLLLAGMSSICTRLGWTYLAWPPNNNSPQTLLAAIAMLLLFSRLRLVRGKRLVSVLGAASFGVYLIHDHPLVRRYTISTYAYHLAGLDTLTIIPGILLAALGIYLVCAIVDTLRQKLFDLLHIKAGFAALERRLIGDLWED